MKTKHLNINKVYDIPDNQEWIKEAKFTQSKTH